MQALLKRETSPRPDSARTELVVRKWLVALGSLFNREITPLLIATWCELLAHLSPEQAEEGLQAIAKSWTFSHFPTPGAVLSQFSKAEEKGFELEAENEWQRLLGWIEQNYFPDTGIRKGAPQLPAATLHAARAAGGFAYIEHCPQDELVWCRNNFLSAYKNVHETGLVENLLGDGEAKSILSRLCAGPVALLPANHDWEGKYKPTVLPSVAVPEPAIVKDRAEPFRVLTVEEWERRKHEQKEHAAAWIAAHPEAVKQGATR